MKNFSCLFFIFFFFILFSGCNDQSKHNETLSFFPLNNYDQTISNWIKPNDPAFDKPVLSDTKQLQRLAIFHKHYFGTLSPWDAKHVNKILNKTKSENLRNLEEDTIHKFNNKSQSPKTKIYSENFRLYAQEWIHKIAENINISQFDSLQYSPKLRAIAIDNLNGRDLPTDDVAFYNHKIPGEGYPFDNLQTSAVWTGTPLYVLGRTQDSAWSLVLTPEIITWVRSSGIAWVNDDFIKKYTSTALNHSVAITSTKTSIIDTNGIYRFSAYIGSVFPGEENLDKIKILIPIANAQQQAVIGYALVAKDKAILMPLAATPHNFSNIMQNLLGRPYGWGNMYFYNDCSAELKNLLAPFGIWLPRNSYFQIYEGKVVDVSAKSPKERIKFLMENGHPFTTLIYVDNHIMMYIGNFPNPNSKNHELIPMTFQNKWGFKPRSSASRAIIGKSVIFPLLEQYPEDHNLITQAQEKQFKISDLSELPD